MSLWDKFFSIIPDNICSVLSGRLNMDRVYELRIRNGYPVLINYNGKFCYLTKAGISDDKAEALVSSDKLAGEILLRAAQFSLYAVNSQICDGYITISGGIRLGVVGEVVTEDDKIKTIKNISSVNIRIPHEVYDCSLKAFKYITGDTVKNTLIISPPGAGKTTLLRDISRLISEMKPIQNVLIIDERCEIAAVTGSRPQLNVGLHTDVISNLKKKNAFYKGIRSMSPNVIITDEIATDDDIEAIDYAINCGVSIIASTHAADQLDLLSKDGFDKLVRRRLFKRYIVLSNKFGPGTYDGIYDENMVQILS